MAKTLTSVRSLSGGPVAGDVSSTISTESDVTFDLDCPAAQVGTLTTRTDNDTGVVTVPSGNPLLVGQFADVYWGASNTRAYMEVTAVTDTTITLDAGTGDNLPAANTAVTVGRVMSQNNVFTGDDVVAMVAKGATTGRSRIEYRVAAGSAAVFNTTEAARDAIYDGTGTNPFAGDSVTGVRVSTAAPTPTKLTGFVGFA